MLFYWRKINANKSVSSLSSWSWSPSSNWLSVINAIGGPFFIHRPFATKKYSVYSRSALRYFWCSSNLCKTPLDLFPVMDLKLTIRWHHFRLPVWPLMHSFEFWWYPVSVHTLDKSSFSSAVTPKKCMLNFKRKKFLKNFANSNKVRKN